MPKLIQSQARGLLSLLTSKDGGLGPPAMEDNLRVNLEAIDFYGLNSRVGVNVGRTAAQLDAAPAGWIAAGGGLFRGWMACYPANGNLAAGPAIYVPDGELWRVHSVTATVARVTGTLGFVMGGWAHGSYPQWRYSGFGTSSGVPGANQSAMSPWGAAPFLALPGSAAAVHWAIWTLGTQDFDLTMDVVYERLPL